jgi:aspartate aminotransferase
MEALSQRIKNLSESATIAMSQKSRELKALGHDVINMSVGEPDFDTPVHIREAAKKAIDENYSHYPPVPGYKDLQEAIVNKLKNENNLAYEPNQIVVSCGAKHSLANVFLAIVDKGDEVIVPTPYWVSYAEQVKLADGENVFLETSQENEFKITPEQLEMAITPKTKVLLLNSPSNPTGSLYTKDELKGLAEVLAKHPDILVVSDEIYEHINYIGKHESIAQFAELKDRVVIINGVSKGFAMTGWRIGYIAAPTWIAKACAKLQGQVTSGASSIAQRASLVALTSDMKPTLEMKEAFERRRDLIVKLLQEIKGIKVNLPKGAFYVFPDMSAFYGKKDGDHEIKNSLDLALYILNNAHVAMVPGMAFGAPDNMRISYATSDENIEKGIERVKVALAKLR